VVAAAGSGTAGDGVRLTGAGAWAAGLVSAALSSFCAAVGFFPVFGWRSIAPSVAVVAAAPMLGHLVLQTWRRPSPPVWASVGAAAGFAALGLLATGLRPTLTDGGGPLAALREGLTDGWAQLLSTSLPVDPEPQLVVVAALVTFAASCGLAELWTRTRARALLAAPPVLALGTGLALGGASTPDRAVLPVVALAIGLACLLALRRSLEQAAPGPRHVPAAPVAVTVLGMAVIGLVLPSVTGAGRSARTGYDPPLLPLSAPSPLVDLLARRSEDPDVALARIEGAGDGWWQIGILDTYDGVRWGESGRYSSAGKATPPTLLATRLGPPRRAEVHLEQPILERRLATPANLTRLEVDDATLLVNERTGARLGARRDGQDLTDYGVVWRPIDLEGIELARPGRADADADDGFPPLPTALTEYAARTTDGSRSWFQQAAALERGVARDLRSDDDVPPDTSLGRLCDLVLRRPASRCDLAPPGMPAPGVVAGPEQAAALFAVLARSRGLPSRLAIGFATSAADGPVRTVRAKDLAVRPEVHFEGYGWVAFDPSPEGSADQPPPVSTGPAASTPAPCPDLRCVVAQNAEPAPEEDPGGDPVPGPAPAAGQRPSWLVASVLVLLALALVAPLAVMGAKAARRARRRGGPPRARVQGAWDEVVDRLLELRIPVPAHAGPADAARLVGPSRAEVAPDLAGFAALVTPGMWAADEPDAAAISAAWSTAASIRMRLAAGLGPAERLRASLSLAPFRRGGT
jgi:hypothetical protein